MRCGVAGKAPVRLAVLQKRNGIGIYLLTGMAGVVMRRRRRRRRQLAGARARAGGVGLGGRPAAKRKGTKQIIKGEEELSLSGRQLKTRVGWTHRTDRRTDTVEGINISLSLTLDVTR